MLFEHCTAMPRKQLSSMRRRASCRRRMLSSSLITTRPSQSMQKRTIAVGTTITAATNIYAFARSTRIRCLSATTAETTTTRRATKREMYGYTLCFYRGACTSSSEALSTKLRRPMVRCSIMSLSRTSPIPTTAASGTPVKWWCVSGSSRIL